MAEMSDNKRRDNNSKRLLVFSRYFFQTLMIAGFLITIFIFRVYNFISNEVVSTLLGTTIGTLFKVAYRSNSKTNEQSQEEQ